jgi:paraquat-inducible protein A
VRFGSLASVGAGPGLLAFAGVVVLTLLATWSFDPKMIWQERRDHGRPNAT